MANRFFKLLYTLGLIAIIFSLPVYFINEVDSERIVEYTYKAKCKENNQYVILQGSHEAYIFNNWELNNLVDSRKDLNFYCKYYREIKPYIDNFDGGIEDNLRFSNFKGSVISSIYNNPELYNLEEINKRIDYYYIYAKLIGWAIGALIAFLMIQFLKICYVYVVFGKLVWHPFRASKKQ